MKPAPLTADTKERVDFLFSADDRASAETILVEECGNNLPFLESATPQELERFRFAVLKISNGNLVRLKDAVSSAKQDWRDLLVAAGFANDLEAHKKWIPRKRNKRFQQNFPAYVANRAVAES
jgi:hypothetical protein